MSRKQTGLRNRFRSGRSTYGKRRKLNGADYYGQPANGVCEDIVAGHVIRYPIGQHIQKVN